MVHFSGFFTSSLILNECVYEFSFCSKITEIKKWAATSKPRHAENDILLFYICVNPNIYFTGMVRLQAYCATLWSMCKELMGRSELRCNQQCRFTSGIVLFGVAINETTNPWLTRIKCSTDWSFHTETNPESTWDVIRITFVFLFSKKSFDGIIRYRLASLQRNKHTIEILIFQ